MGSWDATCGVSQRAIGYSDPGRIIILQQKEGVHFPKSNSTTSMFVPYTSIIRGQYNTGGSLEKIPETKMNLAIESFLQKKFDTKESLEPIMDALERVAIDCGDQIENPEMIANMESKKLTFFFISEALLRNLKNKVTTKQSYIDMIINKLISAIKALPKDDKPFIKWLKSQDLELNIEFVKFIYETNGIKLATQAVEEIFIIDKALKNTHSAWKPVASCGSQATGAWTHKFLSDFRKEPITQGSRICLFSGVPISDNKEAYAVFMEDHYGRGAKGETFKQGSYAFDMYDLSIPVLCRPEGTSYLILESFNNLQKKQIIEEEGQKYLNFANNKIGWISKALIDSLSKYKAGITEFNENRQRENPIDKLRKEIEDAFEKYQNSPKSQQDQWDISYKLESVLTRGGDDGFSFEYMRVLDKIESGNLLLKDYLDKAEQLNLLRRFMRCSRLFVYEPTNTEGKKDYSFYKIIAESNLIWAKKEDYTKCYDEAF